MKYSVIIPFHSNENLLTMCITALSKALDFSESEIIVIDNNAVGSQIPPSVRKEFGCRIIERTENLMYPSAINLGAEYARGSYLIFCDADTCVTVDFLPPLIRALGNDNVGYACARLLNMRTNNILEFGITSSYYNFPHPFAGRSQDFPLAASDHFPLAACAACSAIKRKRFLDFDGFDEELVHSYSDIDLCLRLSDRGYRTACVADARVYHRGSSTIGSGMGESLKEDTKGIFSAKHPHIPIHISEYLESACQYFLSCNRLRDRHYFILDCSTIGNPSLYIDFVSDMLELKPTLKHRRPYAERDAGHIDLLDFIPHTIRNYKVPIFYFVDNFLSLQGNELWKLCRDDFEDIVLDRHANIELLRNI